MARGKRLNGAEIGAIELYKEWGMSNRKIATTIGRSEAVIRNYLKKGDEYGMKYKTKGNSKLTDQQKDQIVTESNENNLTAKQIIDKLDLPVTKQHIALVLRGSKEMEMETETINTPRRRKSKVTKSKRAKRATRNKYNKPKYSDTPGKRSGKWLPI